MKKLLLGLACLLLVGCGKVETTEIIFINENPTNSLEPSEHIHDFKEDYIIPATLTEVSQMVYKCECGETKTEQLGVWCPKSTIEAVAEAALGRPVVEDEDYFEQATVYGIELTCGSADTNTKLSVLDQLVSFVPEEFYNTRTVDDGEYFHYTAEYKYEENVYLAFMTYIDTETNTINGRIETFID